MSAVRPHPLEYENKRLQKELAAANQRIAELEKSQADAAITCCACGRPARLYGEFQQRAEAAERKLADVRQQFVNIQNVARDHAGTTWDGIRSFCKYALAQIEQPQSAPAEREAWLGPKSE